ncbi:Crp/Fnr family transcriptional regulator [Kaistia algarum]|uniref:helix-turn-helix domain-containing protein n=1 Tax=Kaistia algarum TaxID=2083279 RepID=UPI000CE76972|nr:helix-turn-helix domain-containing protein [Kaistia algarum]MCX5514646.1 helix-turn-helix domain-containing protein [Kaistia algarum]PPE78921.1 Crp/Fnr family transcriptional regulator [Kaistia algarum]
MLSQDSIATVNLLVRSLPCEATLPPTLQGVFSRQPIEKFEPGAAVFWEGDEAEHVFEVVEGVLRVYKILGDGRRVITGFMYPGDLIGVSLKDRYLYTAEAVTRIQVRRFGHNRFQEEINRSPELRPQLFARLCDEMAAAQDQMVLLARKSAEERVASFLLHIARRLDNGHPPLRVVEVPMTRLDMADYLGLTIETVSRIMTRLTSRGVIAPSGRHAIIVRKSDKLTALAGEIEADHNASPAYTKQAVWPN